MQIDIQLIGEMEILQQQHQIVLQVIHTLTIRTLHMMLQLQHLITQAQEKVVLRQAQDQITLLYTQQHQLQTLKYIK